MNITTEQKALLKAEMQQQAFSPRKVAVNWECHFIMDRLHGKNETELANYFMKFYTDPKHYPIDDQSGEIEQLRERLREIDSGQVVPSWGRFGS